MRQAPVSADITLADVVPSAAAALGITGYASRCGFPEAAHVVVLLIDGLGFAALRAHDPAWLRSGALQRIDSVVPTTTAVALTSLGTGLLPGVHGMVGASFVLPDTDEVLAPLHWGGDPVPEAVQTEPTVFEAMARAGVMCSSLGPGTYAHSGLTRAALRGPTYVDVRSIDEYVDAMTRVHATSERSFTYVYWPELDRVGHEFGVASHEWESALDRVGVLVDTLTEALPQNSVLALTADHGMVDCPVPGRILWDDLGDLHAGVRAITGEPRYRLIYLDPECDAPTVAARWQARLGPDFDVWERTDLVASGVIGPVEPFAADRLGDLVVVANGDRMLSCPTVDPRISSLPGQHGGWTEAERGIPLVVWRRG